MVEGSEKKLQFKDWKPALEDLKAKGDLVSYDAHSHPLTKNEDGTYDVGQAEPSEGDKGNVVGNAPNVVLGYGINETTAPVTFPRQIGFFNKNGLIHSAPIDFKDFKNVVNRINKK
jgi:hypothetical protein